MNAFRCLFPAPFEDIFLGAFRSDLICLGPALASPWDDVWDLQHSPRAHFRVAVSQVRSPEVPWYVIGLILAAFGGHLAFVIEQFWVLLDSFGLPFGLHYRVILSYVARDAAWSSLFEYGTPWL